MHFQYKTQKLIDQLKAVAIGFMKSTTERMELQITAHCLHS